MFEKMFPYLWKAIRRRKAEKDMTNLLRHMAKTYNITGAHVFVTKYPDGTTNVIRFEED